MKNNLKKNTMKKIEVELKFDVNDRVYFMKENKIENAVIEDIRIIRKPEGSYVYNYPIYSLYGEKNTYNGDSLFESKEAVVKYLLEN